MGVSDGVSGFTEAEVNWIFFQRGKFGTFFYIQNLIHVSF